MLVDTMALTTIGHRKRMGNKRKALLGLNGGSPTALLGLGGVRLALGFYEEAAWAWLLLMRVVGACGARISGQSLGKRGFSARVVTGSDLS